MQTPGPHRLSALRAVRRDPIRDRRAGAASRKIQSSHYELSHRRHRAADRTSARRLRGRASHRHARAQQGRRRQVPCRRARARTLRWFRASERPSTLQCDRSKTPMREFRGQVKHHTEASHGRVKNLFAREDYGFIETADGRQIYFHRNADSDAAFDRLKVGSEVTFAEEEGVKGPQASTVRVVSGHRRA